MWDIIDRFGTLLGIISATIAAWNSWKLRQETKRRWQIESEPIRVVLKNTQGREIALPVDLKRGELTRAELLGRIGMIPIKEKGKRFSISYLNTTEFLVNLSKFQAADITDVFLIPCEDEELEQFDI
jgi:hypothetical protein